MRQFRNLHRKGFRNPSDPTKGGSVHERNPTAWVLAGYRRRDAKRARSRRLRFILQVPVTIEDHRRQFFSDRTFFNFPLALFS